MIDLSVPRRQSKLAIVALAIDTVRRIGVVQVGIFALLIFRAGVSTSVAVAAFLAVSILGGLGLLAWWRFTFHVSGGELIVERGFFNTRRLSIPAERIQSLSIEQELLHRAFGLVKVSIDTAGSDGAEFTIAALERPIAEELERAVLAEQVHTSNDAGTLAAPLGTATSEEIVFAHSPRRLALAALTAWPVAALVLGPIAVVVNQLSRDVSETVVDTAAREFRWWWLPAGLAAAAAAGVVFNLVGTLVQDHRLTLWRDDRTIRRTSGLLSLTSRASAVDRVQVVTSKQNPMQRRAGLTQIGLAAIGSDDISLIGCDEQQVTEVRQIVGLTPGDSPPDRRIHRAQIWLTCRNATVGSLLAAAVLAVFMGWWALLVAFIPVTAWVVERRRVYNFRWALDHRLLTVDHVIDRVSTEALIHKANAVVVTQSLFERRRGLASVELATAAGSVEVGMLPVDEARAVRDVVLHSAETDVRRWM